MITIMTAGVIG